MTISPEKN